MLITMQYPNSLETMCPNTPVALHEPSLLWCVFLSLGRWRFDALVHVMLMMEQRGGGDGKRGKKLISLPLSLTRNPLTANYPGTAEATTVAPESKRYPALRIHSVSKRVKALSLSLFVHPSPRLLTREEHDYEDYDATSRGERERAKEFFPFTLIIIISYLVPFVPSLVSSSCNSFAVRAGESERFP